MLDEIERLFEVYRKTTDEAERAAIYHRIDSISYEASKIAIPNEYDKLMSAIGANGHQRLHVAGHDRIRRGHPFERDRQLGQDPGRPVSATP